MPSSRPSWARNGGPKSWGQLTFQVGAHSFSASPSANPVGKKKETERIVPKWLRHLKLVPLLGLAAVALTLPASASGGSAGGVGPGSDPETAPAPVAGERAKLLPSGLAAAPQSAPAKVKRAIDAANRIDDAGYCMGGGHGKERCYDCSGTASYVLGSKGADVLEAPLPSGGFRKWGERGKGS